jgi:hypothetical protein
MASKNRLKTLAKEIARPLLYRFPPIYLSPGGLHLWLDALVETADLEGEVVEIGCYLGATAALSSRFLKEIGCEHQYVVIDTFGGFVEAQFESELKQGGGEWLRYEFSGNSPSLARWVMNKHGGEDVKMIVGDISKIDDSELPQTISACLLDIDLADPIYDAMHRIYPRLSAGGVVIIDDCNEGATYKARLGLERFARECNIAVDYRYGKGMVKKRHQAKAAIPVRSGGR